MQDPGRVEQPYSSPEELPCLYPGRSSGPSILPEIVRCGVTFRDSLEKQAGALPLLEVVSIHHR
jgi:hypothetical protein